LIYGSKISAALRGFPATARLSCCLCKNYVNADAQCAGVDIGGRK